MDTVSPDVRVGHVHLKVSDLERSIAFYRDAIGMNLMAQLGDQAAFLSASDYHHHIGLNTWESAGGSAPPAGTTGLYHFALVYPTLRDLSLALRRLQAHGVQLQGASDHGVSIALYLADPDQNGIELYWDRPRDAWPLDAEGNVRMMADPVDVQELLSITEANPV